MKLCKYGCGRLIYYDKKDPNVKGDTGFREADGTPHLYKRCFDMQNVLPSTKPYQGKIGERTVKVIPETHVEHPNIFEDKYHLCPKCKSKLWVTVKFNARESMFYKKCYSCKHEVKVDHVFSAEDINKKRYSE